MTKRVCVGDSIKEDDKARMVLTNQRQFLQPQCLLNTRGNAWLINVNKLFASFENEMERLKSLLQQTVHKYNEESCLMIREAVRLKRAST